MRILMAAFSGLLASPAFAQGAAVAEPSPMLSMLPLLLVFGVFYFLLIRPQQKRFREHQDVLTALKKGDVVVTGGGIIGKITKLADDVAHLEIASDVEVKVLKSTVSGLHGAKAAAATEKATPASKKKNAAVKNDNVVPSKENVANDN